MQQVVLRQSPSVRCTDAVRASCAVQLQATHSVLLNARSRAALVLRFPLAAAAFAADVTIRPLSSFLANVANRASQQEIPPTRGHKSGAPTLARRKWAGR